MTSDPSRPDETEPDGGVLGSEPGGTDMLGQEAGGTDELGPEAGGTDELRPGGCPGGPPADPGGRLHLLGNGDDLRAARGDG